MSALDFATGPSYEVVIVGDLRAKNTRIMLEKLRGIYLPQKVVLFKSIQGRDGIGEIAPYTQAQRAKGRKATAYVCRNFACERPTTDPKKMLESLAARSKTD